jgi:hypothetical protein
MQKFHEWFAAHIAKYFRMQVAMYVFLQDQANDTLERINSSIQNGAKTFIIQ